MFKKLLGYLTKRNSQTTITITNYTGPTEPSEELKNICRRIGEILYELYGDEAKTRINNMRLYNMILDGKTLTLYTPRVGIWIGKRGALVNNLEHKLGLRIKFIETNWNWQDLIQSGIPYDYKDWNI